MRAVLLILKPERRFSTSVVYGGRFGRVSKGRGGHKLSKVMCGGRKEIDRAARREVNALLSILLSEIAGGLVGFLASTAVIVVFGEIVPQATCNRCAPQERKNTARPKCSETLLETLLECSKAQLKRLQGLILTLYTSGRLKCHGTLRDLGRSVG